MPKSWRGVTYVVLLTRAWSGVSRLVPFAPRVLCLGDGKAAKHRWPDLLVGESSYKYHGGWRAAPSWESAAGVATADGGGSDSRDAAQASDCGHTATQRPLIDPATRTHALSRKRHAPPPQDRAATHTLWFWTRAYAWVEMRCTYEYARKMVLCNAILSNRPALPTAPAARTQMRTRLRSGAYNNIYSY